MLHNSMYLKFGDLVLQASYSKDGHDKLIRQAKIMLRSITDDDISHMLVILTKKHFEIGDGSQQVNNNYD